MRNTGKFYRTNEVSRESSNKSDWLEGFAEKMAIKEVAISAQEGQVKTASDKTAVEVARTRQDSVYNMMSHILNPQKPKFSSVEDVVKHYQEKIGLNDYLKSCKEDELKAMAALVSSAADDIEEDSDNAEWNDEKKD